MEKGLVRKFVYMGFILLLDILEYLHKHNNGVFVYHIMSHLFFYLSTYPFRNM